MIVTESCVNIKSPITMHSLRVLMVTGVYPTAEQPHKGTFIKSQVDSLIAAGVEVEVIHPKPGPLLMRYLWTTAQVFLKAGTKQFDIVHGHYGQWCLLSRMQWSVPVVASFLGDDLLGTPLGHGRNSKLHALIVHISRWLCGHVDAVIVKSEQMKKASGRECCFVIPNGVDFELFRWEPRAQARAALGWDPDRHYILFGNDPTIPRKGFDLAQEAIERLHTKGILCELVVANGLPQTTLVQYINASNALILSSISEGSPNIVKEAMACNVPIVATHVGDVAEVIGRTEGCSICQHDPDELAAGIERTLLHSGPTTGRADISHLECSRVAQRVIAVYGHVLQKKDR